MNDEYKLKIKILEAKLLDLNEGHDELRAALRNTAAAVEALKAMLVVVMSITDFPKARALEAVTIATDALSAEMDAAGSDPEFQRAARESLDQLTAAVVSFAGPEGSQKA